MKYLLSKLKKPKPIWQQCPLCLELSSPSQDVGEHFYIEDSYYCCACFCKWARNHPEIMSSFKLKEFKPSRGILRGSHDPE